MTLSSFRVTAPVLVLVAITVVGCGADSITGSDHRTLSMIDQAEPIGLIDGVEGGADYEVPIGGVPTRTPSPKGVVAACAREGFISFAWEPPVEVYVARIFWNGSLLGEVPASEGKFLWGMPRITGQQHFAICYQRSGTDGPAVMVSMNLDSYAGEGANQEPAAEDSID